MNYDALFYAIIESLVDSGMDEWKAWYKAHRILYHAQKVTQS